jgi:hypothetical protein
MKKYNPVHSPDSAQWLKLTEQQRIQFAEAYHRSARIKLPNLKTPAVFHAIVENQIAEGLAPVVRAVGRLMHEGLSRHDAIHAIGFVVAEHLSAAFKAEVPDDADTAQARYAAAVEQLDGRSWRERAGG